ncbi:MAG: bifunctional 2-C-methyl-D-erythritol 4-phosphate cytidylyltransferase/2-C-methyl-D-erythritol 2,4-cyclodiphosphate synthase [Rhizobiaceae bacterium]|nr:bifunctional 2-C-methyl-D-erythritol 4-phosphate cytidylyltransferase/2-C-methyl-D-erythritol 2,4-cyclodiphosphate synthase [Rhizobiaceae bacterium]
MSADAKASFPRTIAVVIVAAGRGERAGAGEGPKQYRPIGGRPVIWHTVRAFTSHPRVGDIVVAIHPDDETLFRAAAGDLHGRVRTVHGGRTRQASTLAALRALAPARPDAVLIHDGVRPFVDHELIDRTVAAIGCQRGALPCMPVSDTLKHGADGVVGGTVSRAGLFAAQTPQGFPFMPILAAHEAAAGSEEFTDDAAIAEAAGLPVEIVVGSPDNVKITWARDIALADDKLSAGQARWPDVRSGSGYDVHAFAPGDQVTLCGIAIPHDRTLSGHSDADVALHALTDALLATCGAGDIGDHFPPSDPQWRGAPSRIFLEHAADIVRSKGGRIANADVTLICEAPRIGPHRAAMRDAVAGMLRLSVERVSVKATTNERLGFVGRQEGIAAIATASVVYPGGLVG